MKDSKAGSCPIDGFAVSRGFLGESKVSLVIHFSCLAAFCVGGV